MARGKTADTGPHPFDVYVGKRVCAKRLALGFNQSDLGRALGLTFQQVQKYEKGANRISASKLWEISKFFGVPYGWFAEGYENRDFGVDGAVGVDLPATAEEARLMTYARKATPNEIGAVVALLRRLTVGR